jgi:hypothetical protein
MGKSKQPAQKAAKGGGGAGGGAGGRGGAQPAAPAAPAAASAKGRVQLSSRAEAQLREILQARAREAAVRRELFPRASCSRLFLPPLLRRIAASPQQCPLLTRSRRPAACRPLSLSAPKQASAAQAGGSGGAGGAVLDPRRALRVYTGVYEKLLAAGFGEDDVQSALRALPPVRCAASLLAAAAESRQPA